MTTRSAQQKQHGTGDAKAGYHRSRRFNPLVILGAMATGATAGIYADKVLAASNKKYSQLDDIARKFVVGASTILGAGIGMGLSALHGTDYNYAAYTPTLKSKQAPTIIAFSGAAGGDWQDTNLDREALDKQFGKDEYAIFSYRDIKHAEEYMRRLPRGAALHIIGHSMGGPAAYALAQRAALYGHTVKRLDTLDPVGTHLGYRMDYGKPEAVVKWNNYYVAKRNPAVLAGSDHIALAGGAMDALPGADNKAVKGKYINHKTIRYAMPGRGGRKIKPPKELIQGIYND